MAVNDANDENENRLDAEAATGKVRKLVISSSPDGDTPDGTRNPGKGNKKRDALETEKSNQPQEESSESTQRNLVVPPKVEAASDDTRNPGKGNKKRGLRVTEDTSD